MEACAYLGVHCSIVDGTLMALQQCQAALPGRTSLQRGQRPRRCRLQAGVKLDGTLVAGRRRIDCVAGLASLQTCRGGREASACHARLPVAFGRTWPILRYAFPQRGRIEQASSASDTAASTLLPSFRRARQRFASRVPLKCRSWRGATARAAEYAATAWSNSHCRKAESPMRLASALDMLHACGGEGEACSGTGRLPVTEAIDVGRSGSRPPQCLYVVPVLQTSFAS